MMFTAAIAFRKEFRVRISLENRQGGIETIAPYSPWFEVQLQEVFKILGGSVALLYFLCNSGRG